MFRSGNNTKHNNNKNPLEEIIEGPRTNVHRYYLLSLASQRVLHFKEPAWKLQAKNGPFLPPLSNQWKIVQEFIIFFFETYFANQDSADRNTCTGIKEERAERAFTAAR